MFDRETYIRSNLQAHYNEAVQSGQMVFCLILQGSQNYGLDINNEKYQSDIDTKAIILPSFEDFCRGSAPISTTHIRENNEHIDFKDVRVMFETFKKQNVNFVEVLFSDYYIVAEGYESFWEDLRALAEDLTHCHPTQTLRTMAGLSLEKRKALCHPYPTIKDKIDKYGYDGKQLHHIIRINDFIKRYVAGESFKACLHPTPTMRAKLDAAKLNEYSLEDALRMADEFCDETNAIRNAYMEKYGNDCDGRAYKKLDEIKVELLRKWFRKELAI